MGNQGKSIKNRRALAQGVSDHQKCAFDISHFHFFDFDFLGEYLQSKPTQTAISNNFSKPEPWTRIRATNRTRIILSCLSYAHARRRPWELSNTPVVANFQQGFCFLALRNVFFFWTMVPNGALDGFKNVTTSDKNDSWNEVHRTCWNVLNLRPSDLQETLFRMEGLPRITKTRGADKYNIISKHCVDMKQQSMKDRSRNTTKKRCLKTEPHKSKQY